MVKRRVLILWYGRADPSADKSGRLSKGWFLGAKQEGVSL